MMTEKLRKAAEKEDWDFVDENLPKVSNNPKFINLAKNIWLDAKNKHIRDLAASLLEQTNVLDEETEEKLYSRMSKDPHPPVRFRSAFALTKHKYNKHNQEVTDVLQQATQDPDIKEIAEYYLKK